MCMALLMYWHHPHLAGPMLMATKRLHSSPSPPQDNVRWLPQDSQIGIDSPDAFIPQLTKPNTSPWGRKKIVPTATAPLIFLFSFLLQTHHHYYSPLSVNKGFSVMSGWSRDEDKAFEDAIAAHWVGEEGSEENWDKVASSVPTKTLEDVKVHYQLLVDDVLAIDGGHVEVPDYPYEDPASSPRKSHVPDKRYSSSLNGGLGRGHDSGVKGGSRSNQERRKGIPWTEEEHRLFLLGLDKYGKGDWRSISRNFVVSRTPTQVASHAQKYFIRLNSMNKDRRRSSIHDITSVNDGDVPTVAAPIMGQQGHTANPPNVAAVTATGPSPKHRASAQIPVMGMYGTPVGHPIASPIGQLAPAVGTPAMLPPSGHHPQIHPPYMVPVAYPMPPQPLPPPPPQKQQQ
ncbi:hypothetical protein MLD38_012483 [Melastoma candidum]|uniref:Uncharacterized protein n=1 Tax=Melastoma candidum TaxID=119954 RepID=A0ACB9R9K8_9MYRT|nr:hypothetical protein MLD38_012483 [Melastoma candidum]